MTNLSFAPAKVNLYLHVLRRRADGYHDIDSLFVFCDLGDWVEVHPADGLTLEVDGPFAQDIVGENIVLQAAAGLREVCKIHQGATIRLNKLLPVAAGLGGGSSDAAASIRGLCKLWNLDPSSPEVVALASRLGSDVRACLVGEPVIVGGSGSCVIARPELPVLALAMINPGVAVPTAEVYKHSGIVGQNALRLTKLPVELPTLVAWLSARSNHLTEAARAIAPEINEVLTYLETQSGCLLARLSGSGATCFGVFKDLSAASAAASEATYQHPEWWARAATTSRKSLDPA